MKARRWACNTSDRGKPPKELFIKVKTIKIETIKNVILGKFY